MLGAGGCDGLLTLLLILRQRVELFTEGVFGRGRCSRCSSARANVGTGRGDRLLIVAAPPPPPCLLERRLALSEALLGVVACPEDFGEPPAGLVPFAAPVDRDGSVEPAKVDEGRGAGVAELVDPERQRISARTQPVTTFRPVVIKVVVQPGEVVSPPALGSLEPLEGVLVALSWAARPATSS